MNRGFSHETFVSFAVLVVPALGALLSVVGAVVITRTALRKVRDIRDDTKHWRDETYSMWHDVYADKTIQFRQPNLGKPVTVEDQEIGFHTRTGQHAARHRLAEPQENQAFRGELPNVGQR